MPNSSHKRVQNLTNPFLVIATIIIIIFLAGEAFFFFTKRQVPPPGLVSSATEWQTHTNTQEGYLFQYPRIINGPSTIRDDRVEIYEEVDGLLLLVNTIETPNNDPAMWLTTRTVEDFSQKPLRCFSQTSVTDIKSAHDRNKTLLHFNEPVLYLDNIDSQEGKRGTCADFPEVRVVLVQHHGKIFRITFTGSSLSERIVSSFRFTE